jgi:hypothetical protein
LGPTVHPPRKSAHANPVPANAALLSPKIFFIDWSSVFCGIGFSLWVLVLASFNPHRLKPMPQKQFKNKI